MVPSEHGYTATAVCAAQILNDLRALSFWAGGLINLLYSGDIWHIAWQYRHAGCCLPRCVIIKAQAMA